MIKPNNIRKNLDNKKVKLNSEDELRDKFNNSATLLINNFLTDVLAGRVQITDTADMSRLFQIYMQVNAINLGEGEGNGALPEVSLNQKAILEDKLQFEKEVDSEGEEVDYIDLSSLENLSSEDLEVLRKQRENELNKENEATF